MSESGSNQLPANTSILFCTPVRGGTAPSHNQSRRALEAWCKTQEIAFDVREVAEAPIEVARDTLAAAYLATMTPLDKPYTHCLMIDAGVGFSIETIQKLLAADEDFVAAAVPLRQVAADEAVRHGDPRYAATFVVQHTRETRETRKAKIVNKGGAAFMEIDAIGAALICIRQKVLMRLYDAYPELRSRQGMAYFQPTNLTEDGESYVTLMRTAIEKARARLEDGADPAVISALLNEALTANPDLFDRCGEDIAVCRRYRRLDTEVKPAKIWLLCDATIMHEGHGYFAGNFADTFA